MLDSSSTSSPGNGSARLSIRGQPMNQSTQSRSRFVKSIHRGFTLVEILIVVVILGVLAAIVTPQFSGAVEGATVGTTQTELNKLRRAIEVFQVRNENALPVVTAGDGTWGALIAGNGEYLREAPINSYVTGINSQVIVLGVGPDAAYQTTHGWIYNSATGEIWAGGFDINDNPLPRP